MACRSILNGLKPNRRVGNSSAAPEVFRSLVGSLDQLKETFGGLEDFASYASAAAERGAPMIEWEIGACFGRNFGFCVAQAGG